MRSAKVYRNNEIIGSLIEENTSNYVFLYDDTWFADTSKPSLSLTIPKTTPNRDDKTQQVFNENRKHISTSDVQDKLSLILDKNHLRLTKNGEKGGYILKPIPINLLKVGQVPANDK